MCKGFYQGGLRKTLTKILIPILNQNRDGCCYAKRRTNSLEIGGNQMSSSISVFQTCRLLYLISSNFQTFSPSFSMTVYQWGFEGRSGFTLDTQLTLHTAACQLSITNCLGSLWEDTSGMGGKNPNSSRGHLETKIYSFHR